MQQLVRTDSSEKNRSGGVLVVDDVVSVDEAMPDVVEVHVHLVSVGGCGPP